MQIKNKKDNPVVVKNIQYNSENINSNKPTILKQEEKNEKIIEKPSIRTNKRTVNIEEKISNYEDRVQPYEMVRSKSRKSISTVTTKNIMPETWFCEGCKKINKPYEYKCQGKNYNIIILLS